MTIPGLKIDLGGEEPVYRQIARGIHAAVRDGRLEPGQQLPPTRDLARRLGVNRNTVVSAYDSLAGDGVVRSHTGRGTFVLPRAADAVPGAESEPGSDPWFTAFSRVAEGAGAGALKAIYGLTLSAEGISFVGSYPAAELMPVEPFRHAMDRALTELGHRALAYGPTAGEPSLRGEIAARMETRGSPVGPDEILVTNGAQQALELIFRAFLEPGDAVVIEEPTYTGALSVLGALGARMIAVPLDEEGIRPDLLEIALQRHRPGLIYVQPTFQNPTTRVMSLERRKRILDLATRYRCPVVEDDWAVDLRLEGDDLPSLHALDDGRHVIYLSTFSKKLMPGLRVGWVAAPGPVRRRLIEMKRLQDCGTSPLLQAALHVFLRDGGLESHLDRIRPAYLERRNRMTHALEQHFPREAKWRRPEGGLFVWVDLPGHLDGGELFVAARRAGVLYSRGDLFHSDGSGHNSLRLTFSAASVGEIESGVETLGTLIQERWPERVEPTPPEAGEAMPIF